MGVPICQTGAIAAAYSGAAIADGSPYTYRGISWQVRSQNTLTGDGR